MAGSKGRSLLVRTLALLFHKPWSGALQAGNHATATKKKGSRPIPKDHLLGTTWPSQTIIGAADQDITGSLGFNGVTGVEDSASPSLEGISHVSCTYVGTEVKSGSNYGRTFFLTIGEGGGGEVETINDCPVSSLEAIYACSTAIVRLSSS
jgi:hypothetical protein